MNILQYQDAMNAPELQVWNNAAFDNDESEGRWSSCLEPDPVFVNRSTDSVRSDFSSKENLSPSRFAKTPVSVAAKPLGANTAILNSQPKPPKLVYKEEEKVRDEKRIESEIEEIEREISRLSTRLEALRIEKAERNAAARKVEQRGRIVPAKFMEPPARQSVKNSSEESFLPQSCGAKSKGSNRRGMSLGPSEIAAGSGIRRLSKLEITPLQASQNRRKSSFWKLQEIDELRATKDRRMSLSPKSRKAASKALLPKQPATTACSNRRAAKKEEAILAAIQPKKLFRDGEKSAAATTTAKKPARQGRVVASRYNSAASNDGRKRSLPEEEKEEEAKRCEKKRISLAGKVSRGKKKWEIPSEVVVFRGSATAEEEDEDTFPPAEERRGEVLPRIRTFRWAEKSPRDSGPAKRVAELVGRRSVFSSDEEVSVCQVLSFGEEDGEK